MTNGYHLLGEKPRAGDQAMVDWFAVYYQGRGQDTASRKTCHKRQVLGLASKGEVTTGNNIMASNYGVPSRGKGARGQTVIQRSRAEPARSGATLRES